MFENGSTIMWMYNLIFKKVPQTAAGTSQKNVYISEPVEHKLLY